MNSESVQPTWEPYEEHGRLTTRTNLPDTVFAFPRQRKEPLTDARPLSMPPMMFERWRSRISRRLHGTTG